MTDRDTLRAIQSEAKQLVKQLGAIAALKPTDREALDKLDAALQRLPDAQTFTSALEELREKAISFLTAARQQRLQEFGRIEADYMRHVREKYGSAREVRDGWRVGPLELSVRREQAQVRFLYNHEPLTPWNSVASSDDLIQMEHAVEQALKKAEIAEPELVDGLQAAYQTALRRRSGTQMSPAVAIIDLYLEFRLERARRELSGKPDKKLSQTELPRWAFLYNLDRYRSLSSRIPEEKRLGFQTGSMVETTKLGVTLNGLRPEEDYKKYCFVTSATS
jgi:hypothetical protein